MADIFISHSSSDNDLADTIGQWLARDRESWSVFLDKDPRGGILAGQGWQDRLQRELQSCRLVLAIVTPSWLGSSWCFTEAVAATFRGKDFIAVMPEPLSEVDLESAPPIVHDRQRQPLDLATGAGWENLLHALDRSGLDPDQWFAIPEDVGPYPGFVAFEERDAGVFFGRDQEITQYLDDLSLLKAPGRSQALVISGGSGTGKSSLLKAGLIPRLRRQEDWLVLPPFDLSREPIHALWASLQEAFRATGTDFAQVPAPPREPEALAEALGDALRTLEEASGAWLLLPLDQAEVLLADARHEDDGPADSAVLLDAVGRLFAARTRKLVAVLTIRTEFMPALERALPPSLRLQNRSLWPIAGLSEIIEKPAARFGIQLEEGLTGLMVEETHGAEALPLLAYTLRELYERYGRNNLLTVEAYVALGRVEGAIRRKVHEVFTDPAPSPEEMAAFRRCVVRYLVRADSGAVEGERYLRTAVKREALPQGAARLIDRLLEARLLVGGDDTVAIAHERFIADWPDAPLRRWLAEDRSDRELIESLKSRMAEHDDGGPLLSEKPLLDAKDFVTRDPALREDEPKLYRFIADSDAAERRRQNRRRWLLGGAIAASLVFFAVAVGAILFYFKAQEQTRIAQRNEDIANAQRDRAQFAQGVRLLERSDAEWARGDHLEAKISACVAVGFEGCGRETVDDLLKERFPVLITAEHEAERAHARRTILEHPGYRLVWQSPISRHHDGPIEALAYSQSGAVLATAGDDNKVKLWDTQSGAKLAELTGHTNAVAGVAFAEQAGLLVSVSHDRTLRLWSLEDGAEIATLWGHRNAITSVDVTESAAYAASGGWDDVKIWDLAEHRELVSLGIERQGGTTVAFSPAGDILAVSGQLTIPSQDEGPHDVQLFEVPSGRPLRRLEGDGFGTDAIAFSRDGALVAAAGESGNVFVWQVDDGKRVAALRFPGEVADLAFQPGSGRVALAGRRVALWDIATGELTWMPPNEGLPATTVANSPDGTTVAVAGENGFVSLWQPASGQVSRAAGHVGTVQTVAVSPDGRLIASAGPDGLRLWNAVTGRPADRAGGPTGQRGRITGLAFSPNARWLAASYERGEATVYDTATQSEVARLVGLGRTLNSVAFSADSELLFLAGSKLSAWNPSSKQMHASVTALGGEEGLTDVAPLTDGKRIITGSERGAQVWTIAGLEEPGPQLGRGAAKVAVAADGSSIALAGFEGGLIEVVRPSSIEDPKAFDRLEGHQGEIVDLAYGPFGKLLASASLDGTIRLWRDKEPYAVIQVGPAPPSSIAFSADGSLLVSGRADGALQIWRLPDDQERLRIRNLPGEVLEAKLSPGGRYLATLARLSVIGDSAFQLWDVKTGRETASFTASFSSGSFGGAESHLAFSADSARLAVGGWRELSVVDTETGLRTKLPLKDPNVVGFAFDPDGALIVATRSAPEASQVDVERIDLEGNGTQATPLDKGTPPSLASGQILVSSRESGYRLWDTYDLATLGAGDAVQDILGARQSSQLYLSAAFEVLGWHGDGLWIWDPAEARLVRRFDAGQLSGDGARVFLPRDGHIDVLDAISGAQVDEYRFDSGESTGFTDSAAETAVYSGTNLRVFESSVTVDYTTYLDIADVGDQGIVWRSTSDNLHAARGGRHFSPPPWSLSGGALHVQAADGKQLFWSLVGADDIEGATHLMAMSPLLTAPGAFDEGKAWLLLRMIGKELNLDRMRFGSVGELVDFTIDDTTRDRLQGLAFQGIIEARHFAALPTEWLKYLLREFGPNMSASVAEHMDLEKALSLSHWFEKRTPKTAIALAEAAIAAAPDDGRAYTRRGYARARAGDLEDAIADFEEAVTLAKGADANGSDDRRLAKALYDLACGLSLHAAALQTEAAKSAAAAQALDRLSEAVSAGYNDWGHIAEDRDLGEVRADPSFEARLSAWKSGSLSTPAEVKED